ncbi:MAG: chloride channel protein [Chloroflexi bacterium]|nr:chloride channel protein [Chloroflexota bacterium]
MTSPPLSAALLTRRVSAALRWLFLAGLVGVLAGTASAVFLILLTNATGTFASQPALIVLLPFAGLLIGWVYWRFGGAAARGNNLVIEEIHVSVQRVPFRMAPLVLIGTVATHLFGGSAGREGTAIQMSASMADTLRRLLRLEASERRLLLMAAISGGFGSVFGTPAAGFVFGMEVQAAGRMRYEGALPCLIASVVGDLVTRAWGVGHAHYPQLAQVEIDPMLLMRVVLASVIFGLASVAFIELTHLVKHTFQHRIAWAPLRPFIGGIAVIGLTLIVGTNDYNGLSLPLIQRSLNGEEVLLTVFLLKIVFTAVTLGSGFLGGEVTPLFVIGATCGAALAPILGIDAGLLGSIGFVAVFAGATNTPIACTMMAVELFGGGGAIYVLVGCVVAYQISGQRSIYTTQRVATPKWGDER